MKKHIALDCLKFVAYFISCTDENCLKFFLNFITDDQSALKNTDLLIFVLSVKLNWIDSALNLRKQKGLELPLILLELILCEDSMEEGMIKAFLDCFDAEDLLHLHHLCSPKNLSYFTDYIFEKSSDKIVKEPVAEIEESSLFTESDNPKFSVFRFCFAKISFS